ncbi:hypothetical protein CAL26_06900 [Bordetella genomosp. 9]|uniref:DUF1097 domain-containing protein n=1 Tax=Bordetella genomosp. 9 TaxID=1416803 RepID=A0A261RDU2_9BORD|nr:DUF1097 domain-containing protein [Bordetella genomosp. 9]OZI23198.1 hypothetical protein CAL26_06900 [Bordetella genomosp. 9]
MAGNNLGRHMKVVLGESIVASSAATVSTLALELPVWAMFVGWIAYFTRGLNLRSGLVNLACVLMGVALGMGAAHGLGALAPLLGDYAISAVVVAVTAVALSLARLPVFNNLLGFFLGLVAYFASHLPPTPTTFASLGLAAALGGVAAFCAHAWQHRVNAAERPRS